jgi:hypothetical protein
MSGHTHWRIACTFGIESFGASAMLRIVVHEHIVGDRQQWTIDNHLCGNHNLRTMKEKKKKIKMKERLVNVSCRGGVYTADSPEIVACHVDCQHFSSNSDYTSRRILRKICGREMGRKERMKANVDIN